MINLEDIHSLTDFARNTKAYAKKLKKTGRPAVLTVNGRVEFVVQDAKSYHLLNIAQQYAEDRKLDQAFEDVEAGRVSDFEDVAKRLKLERFGAGGKRDHEVCYHDLGCRRGRSRFNHGLYCHGFTIAGRDLC